MITAKEVHDIMNQNLSQNEKEVQSVAIKILDKIVRKILDEANSGRIESCINATRLFA